MWFAARSISDIDQRIGSVSTDVERDLQNLFSDVTSVQFGRLRVCARRVQEEVLPARARDRTAQSRWTFCQDWRSLLASPSCALVSGLHLPAYLGR
jgi:hypothetical protein